METSRAHASLCSLFLPRQGRSLELHHCQAVLSGSTCLVPHQPLFSLKSAGLFTICPHTFYREGDSPRAGSPSCEGGKSRFELRLAHLRIQAPDLLAPLPPCFLFACCLVRVPGSAQRLGCPPHRRGTPRARPGFCFACGCWLLARPAPRPLPEGPPGGRGGRRRLRRWGQGSGRSPGVQGWRRRPARSQCWDPGAFTSRTCRAHPDLVRLRLRGGSLTSMLGRGALEG